MVTVHNPYDFILVNSSYKSILEHPSVQTSYDYFSVDVPFSVDSRSLINRTIKLHLVGSHHTTASYTATTSSRAACFVLCSVILDFCFVLSFCSVLLSLGCQCHSKKNYWEETTFQQYKLFVMGFPDCGIVLTHTLRCPN